jgi:hypothetical protein
MLFQRFFRTDNYRMPPLATHVPDRAAIALFKKWINGLAVSPKKRKARGNRRRSNGSLRSFGSSLALIVNGQYHGAWPGGRRRAVGGTGDIHVSDGPPGKE